MTGVSEEDKLQQFYNMISKPSSGAKYCHDKTKMLPNCEECIIGTRKGPNSKSCNDFITPSKLIRDEILKLTKDRFGDEKSETQMNKPFGLYPYLEGPEFMIRHYTFAKQLSTKPIHTLIDIGAYYNPIHLYLSKELCPTNIIVIEPILDPLSVQVPCTPSNQSATTTTTTATPYTHILYLPITFKYYMDIRHQLPSPKTVVCIGCDSHYGPSRKMLETAFVRPYTLYLEYPSEYIHNAPFRKMPENEQNELMTFIKKFQAKTNETIYTKRVMKVIEYIKLTDNK